MSSAPANHDSSQQDIERNDVLNAIGRKWGKFSKQELSVLKTNDELVGQVVRKYGMEKSAAQSDVDTLMAGWNL
jgi:hypothetical protein